MSNVNLERLDNPFECVWYCFEHKTYCEHCTMMGDCTSSGPCVYALGHPDSTGAADGT